jgi:hypothetical protein
LAITPIQDITVIKAILEQDPYMNSIGYNSSNIYRYDQLDEEITTSTKCINIFLMPSPYRRNQNVLVECIYGFKIISTRNNIGDVSNAASQIQALLQNREIGNNHLLELYDPPMQMSSPKGTVVYELSFMTLASIYTPFRSINA